MKKIFLLIVFVICFITLIIVSLIDSNSTFYVTTVPKSYSFVSTYFEDDIMEVILYISDKRTSLTNIDNINKYHFISISLVHVWCAKEIFRNTNILNLFIIIEE